MNGMDVGGIGQDLEEAALAVEMMQSAAGVFLKSHTVPKRCC